MSREDVEEIIEVIKKEVQELDSNIFVVPVGGYRYVYVISIFSF